MNPSYTYPLASRFSSPWSQRERILLLIWEWCWILFCYWTPKPANAWRVRWLRLFGAKISGNPFVHSRARVTAPWRLTLHDRACLGDRANAYSLGEIEIQSGATIAQEAYLCTGTHEFNDEKQPLKTAKITIESEAFIGLRAVVMPGVVVGKNAVIGAGSIVTKDIPPNSIAAGNPCRVIRQRET